MKKLGLLIFISALVIGSLAAIFSKVGKIAFNHNDKKQSSAETSEKRNLKDFKKVEISSAIKAKINNQNDFEVEVQAGDNSLETVKTVVEGDVLKIYREGNSLDKGPVSINISLPTLEGVEISGASKTEIDNAAGDQLTLSAGGASKISVNGEVNHLKAEASGASSIQANDLKAAQVEVQASGASKASVFATDALRAEASGASRITYTGDPKTIDESATGASSVTRK